MKVYSTFNSNSSLRIQSLVSLMRLVKVVVDTHQMVKVDDHLETRRLALELHEVSKPHILSINTHYFQVLLAVFIKGTLVYKLELFSSEHVKLLVVAVDASLLVSLVQQLYQLHGF